MNAEDRKVIRDALEMLCKQLLDGANCTPAAHILRIIDKPQPESSGDARELAERLGKECFSGVEGLAATWRESKATEIIQAFAARIRAETLEEAAKWHEKTADNLDDDPTAQDAAYMHRCYAERIRSLTPTGTP